MNKCTFLAVLMPVFFSFFLVNTVNAWTIEQNHDDETVGQRSNLWKSSQAIITTEQGVNGTYMVTPLQSTVNLFFLQ